MNMQKMFDLINNMCFENALPQYVLTQNIERDFATLDTMQCTLNINPVLSEGIELECMYHELIHLYLFTKDYKYWYAHGARFVNTAKAFNYLKLDAINYL